jgi:TFIIF-interacting CTD phosphatase-like protein
MKDRMYVYLDLDQTLVHAVEEDELSDSIMTKCRKAFAHHDMPDNPNYTVFERPGLQPFLDYLFANYNVCIWTAASKLYALYVIDNCILAGRPERKLHCILFSFHGDISRRSCKKTKSLKELPKMGLPDCKDCNTVIVDDYDEVYYTQPENCIIAPGFYVDDKRAKTDTYLSSLVTRLHGVSSTSGGACKKINEGISPKPRRD